MTQPESGINFDLRAYEQGHDLIAGRRALPPKAVELLAQDVVRHLAGGVAAAPASWAPPPDEEIEALCAALVSADPQAALTMLLDVYRKGAAPDLIYLGYVAGAARRLGAMWDEDLLSFYDVTVAAGRIFGLLRAMRFLLVPAQAEGERHAVFATVPGEDHAIGVTIAADMFRREGWQIDLHLGLSHEALIAAVRGSGARIAAVSAASRRSLLPLARLVVGLHVMHPPALVMVSGHLTLDEPEFVAHLGADAIARDMPEALAEMERLLDIRRGAVAPGA